MATFSIFIVLNSVACYGPQSALVTAGVESSRVAMLFWIMAAAAILIWLGMLLLMRHAARVRPHRRLMRRQVNILVVTGIALPLIVLTPLLGWALSLMSQLRPSEATLRIEVIGERWWWRVHYLSDDGSRVVSANEIRMPIGSTALLQLRSADVIHSLWIPALGGKMDMVPGRTTELVLQPTRNGVYRGVCAEFCGSAHAQMAFFVEVMPADAFERWLRHQAGPAVSPVDAEAIAGAQAFQRNGCGGCHAVRGTAANGSIGPDLTHLASRHSLAAGELPNDVTAMQNWLLQPDRIKPGALMPSFHHLPEAEREALAGYLSSLL